MFYRKLVIICCVLLGFAGMAYAESSKEVKSIEAAISRLMPGEAADSIAPAPIAGLYEVTIGTQILYMTGDGRYLISGDVVDVASRTNLTEPRRDMIRADVINAVGEENMIVFAPEKTTHTITVFTDIDCGYCRKLHKEIDQYNEKGIKVRYLMYPRNGLKSPAYDKAVTVWCSDDRNQAMTDAKAGKKLAAKKCDNPVRDHFKVGESLALRGTPAIVLEDGRMIPGYVSATRMAQTLGIKKNVVTR